LSGIEVSQKLVSFVQFIPVFFLSITVHEFAHAYSAFKLGDDTAQKQGRLTLNPVKHIDLIGSVIMPLAAFASGYALIGWAKPVPVNRGNFKNELRDDAIVSFAGPLSNLILALLFFAGFVVLYHNSNILSVYSSSVADLLWHGFYFNLFLFFFNLMPIPPLDGVHIIYDLFPNTITARLVNFGLFGSIILMFFIYSPLWGIFIKMINFVVKLFVNLAGI
jgi:Zn-dependent proteases